MPTAIETRLKFGAMAEKIVAEYYKSKGWNIHWPNESDSWDVKICNNIAEVRLKITRDFSMASTGYHSLLYERNGSPTGIASKDFDMWCVVDIESTMYCFEANKLKSFIKKSNANTVHQMHKGKAYSLKFDKIVKDLKPMTVLLKPQKKTRHDF